MLTTVYVHSSKNLFLHEKSVCSFSHMLTMSVTEVDKKLRGHRVYTH